jgi:hypothetical protein
MSLQREEVDKLLAPAFVDGLGEASIDEIRARRDECRRVEDLISYLRRVIQGQIDVVTAEIEMRAGGVAGDAGRLVHDLPSILSGPPQAPSGSQAIRQQVSMGTASALSEVFGDSQELTPDEIAAALSPELAGALLTGDTLPGANLASFGDVELTKIVENLQLQEADLSAQRRILHERLDQLTAAMVDRYKTGAADSDTLLADADADLLADADADADPATDEGEDIQDLQPGSRP